MIQALIEETVHGVRVILESKYNGEEQLIVTEPDNSVIDVMFRADEVMAIARAFKITAFVKYGKTTTYDNPVLHVKIYF